MGCNTSQEQVTIDTVTEKTNLINANKNCLNTVNRENDIFNKLSESIAKNGNYSVVNKSIENSKIMKTESICNFNSNKCLAENLNSNRITSISDAFPIYCLTENNEFSNLNYEKAALKIQALYRGHRVRASLRKTNYLMDFMKEKKDEDSANEPTKEELEAEFDPNDKELCSAATRIQATFRGHLQRKLVEGKNDVDIQEIKKQVAEELDIDLGDPELNKAATKIQASFRGYKTRKDVPANPEH